MKGRLLALALSSILFLAAALAAQAPPAGKVQLLTGEELNKIMPDNFFLDGQKVPTQKRNTVGAQMEKGKFLLVALGDMSGYSSAYQEKYIGTLITQGHLMFGKTGIKPGAYGLGTKKVTVGGKESHLFVLYDLGGEVVAEAAAEKDEKLRPVTPIQLKLGVEPSARLYLGPEFVTLSLR